MADDRDPPIEPQNFLHGVTVVDIGDVRVARGLTRRSVSSCPHVHLVYDDKERRVWCQDCEHDVEAFDAFKILVQRYSGAIASLKKREAAVTEIETFKMRTIAARKMDEAWRHKNSVPACPYCSNGLFPEDFKHGVAMVGKDFARARSTKRTP